MSYYAARRFIGNKFSTKDGVLKFRFENILLRDIWNQMQNEYP